MLKAFALILLFSTTAISSQIIRHHGRPINLASITAHSQESSLKDPKEVRQLISRNDFEDGRMSPWSDLSGSSVYWKIEDIQSPEEVNSPAPPTFSGSKYLRVIRNLETLPSGLAVLRSEPFTASPGDKVDFNFWIRSRRPEGNNLELAVIIGRNETVILELSRFSTPSNFEWRSVDPPVAIPVTEPTTVQLVFYGYCGSGDEDAIGIDDIVVGTDEYLTTTTAEPITTVSNPPPSSCNGTFNGASGFITSPNYPGSYNIDGLDCRYFIDVGSSRARLAFTDFQTESCCDFVEVYDGWSTSNTRLLSAAGSSIPAAVTASSNLMLVRFTTDGSASNYRGFSANYSRA